MSLKKNLEEYRALNSEYTKEQWDFCLNTFGDTPPIQLFEDLRKFYTAKSQKIITESILGDMEELDIDNFENEAVKVSIKHKVNVKTVDKVQLHGWLMEHGYADIIKETVTFPKGEYTTEIEKFLIDSGSSFSIEGTAPAPSVKKIITDRIREGEEIPGDEILEVSHFDFADIKLK